MTTTIHITPAQMKQLLEARGRYKQAEREFELVARAIVAGHLPGVQAITAVDAKALTLTLTDPNAS